MFGLAVSSSLNNWRQSVFGRSIRFVNCIHWGIVHMTFIVCSWSARFGILVFDAAFNTISIISGDQFYWSTLRKTTDLLQVTDKRYQIMVHREHLAMSGIRTHNWLHIGSCKSNYHLITIPPPPPMNVLNSNSC